MAILSRDEAYAILDKVLGNSKAEGCAASLNATTGGNIRYALNTVTTSGSVDDMTLVVRSNYGTRLGTATINEFDDASLEKVVRRSEELARLAPENPEFMEVLGPQKHVESKAFFASTAGITPEYRARAAGRSIALSKERRLVTAGFLNDNATLQAMATSKGLKACHRATGVDFSVTVRTEDGAGSGYAEREFSDADRLDAGEASRTALEKAEMSRGARAIEPGKYTVILEPAASVGLIQNMINAFDARAAEEGRSFLAKREGKTRLGEKIVDERVTLYSDPGHPDLPVSPWAADGLPRERTFWIEKGVVRTLFCSRYWAKRKEIKPVPFPPNGIMEGGSAGVEELIADTKRGILLTRTFYIRSVDPQTLLLTGLTRDGTFFIENGKIAYPVKNMRWNESPVAMLNNLEALGRPERIQGYLVPPMRLKEFTFTSLSDAV